MIANLTTPLIGIVSTIAIGRLGDATLLGGVAIASVIFDCLFWLFAFLRMSTVAFTAQALGADETQELRALLLRGFAVAALIGTALIALQLPLAAVLLGTLGGSEGVNRAAKIYFSIRIWSAPLVLANFAVLGWLIGQARAKLALGVQIAINLINAAVRSIMSRLTESMRISLVRSSSAARGTAGCPRESRRAISTPSTRPAASAITAAVAAPAIPASNTSTSNAVAAILMRLIAICTASASFARACPISQPSTTKLASTKGADQIRMLK